MSLGNCGLHTVGAGVILTTDLVCGDGVAVQGRCQGPKGVVKVRRELFEVQSELSRPGVGP